MMTSALAIKDNFTIKSQNRVVMVQTSKEITRWYYGCNFRLDLVLLSTWVFWVVLGLDATRHSQNNVCWQLANCNFTFNKTRKLATWLQVSLNCQVQTGFQAYSSEKKKRFILSIKIPVVTPPTTSNWVCYIKMADQGIEILIIQDSDLELKTQEYFQFNVYTPSWGSPMLHLTRSYHSHSCLVP